jgi:hypothetical protein
MNELIGAIRTAVADGATTEQKAAGVQACRTISTALGTEPGEPFTLPGMPLPVTSRVSIDQILDLAIARLTTIASEHGTKQSLATPAAALPLAATKPRGLSIPIAPTSALKIAARSANNARAGQRAR